MRNKKNIMKSIIVFVLAFCFCFGNFAVAQSQSLISSAAGVETIATPVASTEVAGSAIKVSWNAISGATSYRVYRSESLSGAKSLLKAVSTTYYNDNTAVMGVTYYYFVKAYDNSTGNLSDYSAGKSAKIPAPKRTLGSRFGYNALSQKEKSVYDALYARACQIDEGTESYTSTDAIGTYLFADFNDRSTWISIPVATKTEVERAFWALYDDNTHFFWLAQRVNMWGISVDKIEVVALSTASNVYCNGSKRMAARTTIYNEIEKVINGAAAYANDYSKEWYVHNYVCGKTIYDPNFPNSNDNPNNLDVSGLFVDQVSVCAAYGRSFHLLMTALGIDCMYITGTVDGGNNHAWNQVKLDGQWYNVDTTWDDIAPENQSKYGQCAYMWFNLTDNQFTEHHPEMRVYAAQKCTNTKYAYANHNENFALTSAAKVVASGSCGDNVTYKLTNDGILTISGSGAMYDYESGKSPFFAHKEKITMVVFEDGVTYVGENLFYGSFALCKAVFSDTVKNIAPSTFFSTELYRSQTGALKYAGNRLIDVDTGVVTASVKAGTVGIADNAFNGCTYLKSLTIPTGVKYLGRSTFNGCSSLKTITIPGTVSKLEQYTFNNCKALESAVLSEGVKTIEIGAFYKCTSLKTVNIPSTVTSIASGAFADCSALTDIYFSGTEAQWRSINKASVNGATVHCNTLSAPTISSAVTDTNKVTLSWNSITGATSYRVFRADTKTGAKTLLKAVTTTTYTDTTAVTGKTYYYFVKAFNGTTSVLSDYSAAKEVTVKATATIAAPTISSAVTDTNKVTLSWNSITGATSYRVFRADTKTGAKTLLKAVNPTTYTDTTAVTGKTYYYFVKAFNGTTSVLSDYSVAKEVTVKAAPVVTTIDAPVISSVSTNTNKVTINWDKVTGATGYRVYRITDGARKELAKVTDTSYVDTTVTTGKMYHYEVKAYNGTAGILSAYSAKRAVKVIAAPVITSANVSPKITWSKVADATSYRVFRTDVATGKRILLKAVGVSTTSYTDDTAESGKTYIYYVRAYSGNASTLSDYSTGRTIKAK